MSMKINELDFKNGVIPVIVQEESSNMVLMLAYAGREALELTVASGLAHFWSRSRSRLWKKGETSGNLLAVSRILVDCDCDALIYLVKAMGPACHTGKKSCFFRVLES